ncbi:unnamed protein product [Trifolium pratense]|uniref:Uncharacterized protein n=1 Tax=Trifolium pratense TaxID=57577 RepID=A0ACB0IFG5_TRIPR|nr:unnamed protein product [Trifolium pratense]
MDENLQSRLTPLCKLALEKYNADNQGVQILRFSTLSRQHGVFLVCFTLPLEQKKIFPTALPKLSRLKYGKI